MLVLLEWMSVWISMNKFNIIVNFRGWFIKLEFLWCFGGYWLLEICISSYIWIVPSNRIQFCWWITRTIDWYRPNRNFVLLISLAWYVDSCNRVFNAFKMKPYMKHSKRAMHKTGIYTKHVRFITNTKWTEWSTVKGLCTRLKTISCECKEVRDYLTFLQTWLLSFTCFQLILLKCWWIYCNTSNIHVIFHIIIWI